VYSSAKARREDVTELVQQRFQLAVRQTAAIEFVTRTRSASPGALRDTPRTGQRRHQLYLSAAGG